MTAIGVYISNRSDDHLPIRSAVAMASAVPHLALGAVLSAQMEHGGLAERLSIKRNHIEDEDLEIKFSGRSVMVVADARLDARCTLIDELRAAGADVHAGSSDRRLIGLAYLVFGDSFLDHLIGDFAFVVWDFGIRRALAARDRFGMRPLFFTVSSLGIGFSSARTPLLKHGDASFDLDHQAVADFLLFGFPEWADFRQTVFRDVRSVAPAELLVWSQECLAKRCYWRLPVDPPLLLLKDPRDYIAAFSSVLTEAVADRIQGEEVVVSMSGGLDSTTIAALAKSILLRGAACRSLSARTITYSDLHPSDDARLARTVALHLGIQWDVVDGSGFRLLEFDRPSETPVQFHCPKFWTRYARELSNAGSIELSGRSADNLLAPPKSNILESLKWVGLARTISTLMILKRRYNYRPSLGSGLWRRRKPTDGSLEGYPPWFAPEFERSFALRERFIHVANSTISPPHSRMPHVQNLLCGAPWTNEAPEFGLDFEVATRADPFLDIRVVDFVMSIPPLPWFFQKHILRELAGSMLPQEIARRPKKILGDLLGSLLKRQAVETQVLSRGGLELNQFISCEHVPELPGRNHRSEYSCYLDMRAYLLATWLGSWRGLVGVKSK